MAVKRFHRWKDITISNREIDENRDKKFSIHLTINVYLKLLERIPHLCLNCPFLSPMRNNKNGSRILINLETAPRLKSARKTARETPFSSTQFRPWATNSHASPPRYLSRCLPETLSIFSCLLAKQDKRPIRRSSVPRKKYSRKFPPPVYHVARCQGYFSTAVAIREIAPDRPMFGETFIAPCRSRCSSSKGDDNVEPARVYIGIRRIYIRISTLRHRGVLLEVVKWDGWNHPEVEKLWKVCRARGEKRAEGARD